MGGPLPVFGQGLPFFRRSARTAAENLREGRSHDETRPAFPVSHSNCFHHSEQPQAPSDFRGPRGKIPAGANSGNSEKGGSEDGNSRAGRGAGGGSAEGHSEFSETGSEHASRRHAAERGKNRRVIRLEGGCLAGGHEGPGTGWLLFEEMMIQAVIRRRPAFFHSLFFSPASAAWGPRFIWTSPACKS